MSDYTTQFDSDTTPNSNPIPFPPTQRSGELLPVLHNDTFSKAGITTFDDLQVKFGTNYEAVVADVDRLLGQLDVGKLTVLGIKAEIGGRIMLAKLLAEHGSKPDVYADCHVSRDTAKVYIDLYMYLAWALPAIEAEAVDARAKGRDYSPTISHVIDVGKNAAFTAGASTKAKATYSGTAQVWMIDPGSKSVEMVDVPTGFPGPKSVNPHWERDKAYELQADVQLWKEVGGSRRRYYLFDLPLKDSSKPHVVLPLRERAILLRVSKKKELLGITLSPDSRAATPGLRGTRAEEGGGLRHQSYQRHGRADRVDGQ